MSPMYVGLAIVQDCPCYICSYIICDTELYKHLYVATEASSELCGLCLRTHVHMHVV